MAPSQDFDSTQRSTNDDRDDLFQRLGVGEIMSSMLNLFFGKDYFRHFLIISFIVNAPFAVVSFFFTMAINRTIKHMEDDIDEDPNNYDPSDAISTLYTEMIEYVVVQVLLYALLSVIGVAAISKSVGEIYTDNVPNLKQSFCTATNLLGVILGAWGLVLLAYVAFALTVLIAALILSLLPDPFDLVGFLLLFLICGVAIFVVQVRTALLIPAIVIEKKGPISAIKRSWELTGYGICLAFCSLFLMFCASIIITLIWALLVGVVFAPASVGAAILNTVPLFFTFPLQGILLTVLYLYFRVDREGLNKGVLTRDLSGRFYSSGTSFSASTEGPSQVSGVSEEYRPVGMDENSHVPVVDAEQEIV